MRFSFVFAFTLLGSLAACTRAPYATLPTTATYHPSGTHAATPIAQTPATEQSTVAPAAVVPVQAAASGRRAPSRRVPQPALGQAKAYARLAAPLRQLARRPLLIQRTNTAATQRSSATNSIVVAALGIIAAVFGGSLLFLSIVYGAGAGLILVSLLLLLGGIFLAFRHLRDK